MVLSRTPRSTPNPGTHTDPVVLPVATHYFELRTRPLSTPLQRRIKYHIFGSKQLESLSFLMADKWNFCPLRGTAVRYSVWHKVPQLPLTVGVGTFNNIPQLGPSKSVAYIGGRSLHRGTNNKRK